MPKNTPQDPNHEPEAPPLGAGSKARWTLLSNHAHILICLARNGRLRLRDVAERVGVTERSVQKIVGELENGGLVERRREGRRNVYELHLAHPLRHPLEAHLLVRDLVDLVLTGGERRST